MRGPKKSEFFFFGVQEKRERREKRKMAEMFRENLFDGKVAVVTGGGTGIGRDIAFQLLRFGFIFSSSSFLFFFLFFFFLFSFLFSLLFFYLFLFVFRKIFTVNLKSTKKTWLQCGDCKSKKRRFGNNSL